MKKVKSLSFVMTIVSGLYFIYVVSNGSSKMIGDEVGGDPGGMILPLLLSIFMFFGFLYITIKEKPSGQEVSDPVTRRLFIITFISAILYVALQSILGFVITSLLLLYILTCTYLSINKEKIGLKLLVSGGVIVIVGSILIYSVFRFITRILLRLGRAGSIPAIFGNSNMTAFISCLIVTIFLLLFVFAVYKKINTPTVKTVATSGIISYAVVMYLYIVFKQFFMVTLAPGLINW